MTLPAVSLCGHDSTKTLNLVKLYLANKPRLAHRVCLTFNGEWDDNVEHAERLLGVTGLCTSNDGWDIGMHVKAMETLHQAGDKAPWVFCLNDDVVGMKLGWLERAAKLIDNGYQIVGVQPNFMGIFSLEHIAKVRNKPLADVQSFARTNKKIRFMRTYAFAIKTTALYGLWIISGMNARFFEHATLENDLAYAFIEDPETIYDSDYLRFRDGEHYTFPAHR